MTDTTSPVELVSQARGLLVARLVELAEEVTGAGQAGRSGSLSEAEVALREWRKIPGGTLDQIMRMHEMLTRLEAVPNLSSAQARLATAPVLQVAEALQAVIEKVRLRKSEAA